MARWRSSVAVSLDTDPPPVGPPSHWLASQWRTKTDPRRTSSSACPSGWSDARVCDRVLELVGRQPGASWRSTPSYVAAMRGYEVPVVRVAQPVVIHPDEEIAGPGVPGMEVRHHHDPDGRWVGWTGWIKNEAGDVSGWHHHGDNDTFVYIVRGSITVEFGPGGTDRIEARAGDFFLVPALTIHRETTASDGDLDAFVVRIGGEPEYVDVDGPECP